MIDGHTTTLKVLFRIVLFKSKEQKTSMCLVLLFHIIKLGTF